MEQPLDIPITFGFNDRQLIGRLSFPDVEASTTFLRMWADGDVSLSPTVATFRVDANDPLKETKIVPAANFVPIVREEATDEDDYEEES